MNFLILIIMLFFLSLLSLKINKLDIFNFVFISMICYLIGTIFIAIYIKVANIDFDISLQSIKFYFIVFLCLILLNYITNRILNKNYYNNDIKFKTIAMKPIEFSKYKKILIIVLSCIMFCSIYQNYISLAIDNGYNGSLLDFTKFALYLKDLSIYSSKLRLLHINTYFNYILASFSLFSIYIIINNVFICKKRIILDWPLVLIIIMRLFLMYITGWRKEILNLISSSILILGMICKFYKINIDKTFLKIILKNIVIVFIGSVLFFMFTFFVRYEDKTDIIKKLLEYVAIYSGGAIVCFDELLTGIMKFNSIATNSFGINTFYQIYGYLNRLKITSVVLPDVLNLNNLDNILHINIFTTFHRAFLDFGFYGTILYYIILDGLYTILNYIICSIVNKKIKFSSILIIFYSYIATPWFLFTVTDEFSNILFTTKPIYMIIAIIITYFIMFKELKGIDE